MQLKRKGQFVSDDENINRLWEICAHTLRCCAIDGYLDCPSREQRSYLGDAYPEAMIATACFGEPRLTKKIIYDTAFGQRKDGITFSFHPGDYQQQCHIIPDYCFYWIQIAYQYWWYYGDEQALFDLYPHFLRAIDWFWKYIDPEVGLLGDNIPYWIFIDWSYGHDKPGFNAIINTQFMDVLRIVSEIGEKCGDIVTARKYRDVAEKMRVLIDTTFWDEEKGYYHDYIKNGVLSELISQQANSYLVIKGVAPKSKWNSIMANIFDSEEGRPGDIKMQELQMQNRHKGENNVGLIFAQPFFMHHVNRFFSLTGRFDLMFKYFQIGWIPMIEKGESGTIWETWSQDGSECHAWAATPAYDLSTEWLGVRPLQAGFQSIEVSPTFFGLNNVQGIFPTCRGDVKVKWEKIVEDDKIHVELNIEIPDQIEQGACKILPLEGKEASSVETENNSISTDNLSIQQYSLQPGSNHFSIFY
jgi:hypothetical protein